MRNFLTLLVLAIFVTNLSTAQYKKIRSGVWEGTASYYHNKFNGRLTSNGEIFSNKKMTAASNFLKLGTWVRVTNLKNKRSVVVKINDRMNKSNGRLIDMSRISAQKLGYIHAGLTKVRVEVIRGSKAAVARYGKNEYVHSAKKRKAILNGKPTVVAKKKSAKRTALLNTELYTKKKPAVKKQVVKKKKVVKTKPKVKKVVKVKKVKKKTVAKKIAKKKVVKVKPKVTKVKKKAVAKKTIQKKVVKPVAKKKVIVVKKQVEVSNKKSSRYWIEKRKMLKEQLPKSWLETVSNYEAGFKEEKEYKMGAVNSFMDSSQHFKMTLSNLKEDSTYRFILLSRQLNQLDTFKVLPKTLAKDVSLVNKGKSFTNVQFSRDADSYIYFFEYKVPMGTSYIQMEWDGEKYMGASHEDFWMFVFDK